MNLYIYICERSNHYFFVSLTSLKGSPASKMEKDARETGKSTCTDEKAVKSRSATDENSTKTRIGEELEKTETQANEELVEGEVTSLDDKTGKMVAPTIESPTEVPLDENPETIREKQETEKSYPPSFK